MHSKVSGRQSAKLKKHLQNTVKHFHLHRHRRREDRRLKLYSTLLISCLRNTA